MDKSERPARLSMHSVSTDRITVRRPNGRLYLITPGGGVDLEVAPGGPAVVVRLTAMRGADGKHAVMAAITEEPQRRGEAAK